MTKHAEPATGIFNGKKFAPRVHRIQIRAFDTQVAATASGMAMSSQMDSANALSL